MSQRNQATLGNPMATNTPMMVNQGIQTTLTVSSPTHRTLLPTILLPLETITTTTAAVVANSPSLYSETGETCAAHTSFPLKGMKLQLNLQHRMSKRLFWYKWRNTLQPLVINAALPMFICTQIPLKGHHCA